MFSANAAPLQGFARWRNTALLPLDLPRNARTAKARGHALQPAPAAGGHAAGLACWPCSRRVVRGPSCRHPRRGHRAAARRPARRARAPRSAAPRTARGGPAWCGGQALGTRIRQQMPGARAESWLSLRMRAHQGGRRTLLRTPLTLHARLLCGQSTVSVCGGTAVRGAWPRTHAAATRATELGCAAQGSPRHRRCPVLHCARAWRSPPTHARSRVRDALGGFAARLQIRTKPLQPAAASACARTAPGAEQASRRLIRAAPALMPVLQFTRKAFVCKMSALRLALWTRRARLVLRGEAATAAPNPGSLAPYL